MALLQRFPLLRCKGTTIFRITKIFQRKNAVWCLFCAFLWAGRCFNGPPPAIE